MSDAPQKSWREGWLDLVIELITDNALTDVDDGGVSIDWDKLRLILDMCNYMPELRAQLAEAERQREDAYTNGYNAAVEDAARIADKRWLLWRDVGGVECDATACEDIANAIRSLKKDNSA